MYKSDYYCECGCRTYIHYTTAEECRASDIEFTQPLPKNAVSIRRIHISCRDKAPEDCVYQGYTEHWGTWVPLPSQPAWETL